MAENKNKLQSQIDSLTAQKQNHEKFLKTEEPAVIDAKKQIGNIKPKILEYQNQIKTQTQNLNTYLNRMRKMPQIAVAKKQIIEITINIDQLEKERLSL